MNVLVINCGSSSLKYQLIDSVTEDVLAKGLCERIGIDGSQLVYQKAGCDKIKTKAPMPSHQEAISLVLNALMDPENGVIKSLDEIGAAGHRIVHGGEKFTESVVIDDEDTPLSDIDIFLSMNHHFYIHKIIEFYHIFEIFDFSFLLIFQQYIYLLIKL